MQHRANGIGLYGLLGAVSVGFLGLDQVASSYTAQANDDKAPHVSAVSEHVMRSAQSVPAAAPPAKVADTPPRQRPAINGSLGEGSDALDAKELRRRDGARELPA